MKTHEAFTFLLLNFLQSVSHTGEKYLIFLKFTTSLLVKERLLRHPSRLFRLKYKIIQIAVTNCTPGWPRHCPAWRLLGCQQSPFLSPPCPAWIRWGWALLVQSHFGPWGTALLLLSPDTLCSAIITLIPVPSHLLLVWGQWNGQDDKKVKVSCMLWIFVRKPNASIPLT